MPIRISGMSSGLDTDSIITELMKAQSVKKDNLVKAQTTLQWKQDAWKNINSKIYNLYNTTIGSLKYSSAYAKKKTTVSNASIASVVTGGNAVNGVQSLSVKELAKPGYLTGADLKGNYTTSTKMNQIKGMEDLGEGAAITLKTNGKETDITVNSNTTIADVLSQLKAAGVNASFDEKNQRFFISASESGKEADFSLTASNAGGLKVMQGLGLNISLDQDTASLEEYKKYASFMESGYSTEEWNTLLKNETEKRRAAYVTSNETILQTMEKNQKEIERLQNTDMPGFTPGEKTAAEYKEAAKALEERIAEASKNADTLTDEEKDQLQGMKNELNNLNSFASLQGEIEKYQTENEKLAAQKADNDTYLVSSEDEAGKVTYSASGKLMDEVEAHFKNKAVYAADIMGQYEAGTLAASDATRIIGQDAEISLNGAKFTSKSNVFDINGLTITVTNKTAENESISLTTGDDYDAIYDTIKNFLKEFNSLVNEMDNLYNAASAKDYKPLTSDEKKEMTDSEIEEWEKKIKDSLLRKDSTLRDVTDVMSTVMSQGYDIGGTTYYLSDFGINTLGYYDSAENERHAYHIDGDPDDSSTSGKDDILKSLIASDPKLIASFFQKLASTFSDKLFEKMQSSEFSSIYKVYDDKKMAEDYKAYTTKIANQEKRLKTLEDRYYKQFTAMETALAKLNSSQSAITSLLGGGS